MDIGYFRFVEDNLKTRTLNAMAHQFYGLNLIVFGPEDINYDQNTVRGMYLTSIGWKRTEVPLPKIINNMPHRSNSKSEVYEYLNNNSLLLFNHFGNKDYVENLLKENNILQDLIIPSKTPTSPEDLLNMIDTHEKLLFKPTDSNMGRGIFIVEKSGDIYEYKGQDEKYTIDKSRICDIYDDIKNRYIIQKYIKSLTQKGLYFDIRVQYEKSGNGKWKIVQRYARVAISNDIVSNVAKGGSVIRAGLFLRSIYGEVKGRELSKILNEKLKSFPKKFERLYNFNISTIAIDLGLHNDEFYLFEVNSFPGGTFARGEIAILRAAYAKHLAERLPDANRTIVTYEDLLNEIDTLKKENKLQKQQLNSVLKSKSWRYTSIFRKKQERI